MKQLVPVSTFAAKSVGRDMIREKGEVARLPCLSAADCVGHNITLISY